MYADKEHKAVCNRHLATLYLDQRLTADEEARLEAHLAECSSCRDALDQAAADAESWSSVQRYLRADVWDEEPLPIAPKSSASSAIGNGEASNECIRRQIRQWLDPSEDPRYVGRFGGYEILGTIGQGGMGIVLKGFEPSLNRYVAIKALSPLLATTGAARKRFAREAQAAAAVLHENVIAIHRVDEFHGLPYLVMPFVNGVSLQKRIDDEGPLPLTVILRIGRQIAAGLAAAHAQGLVHRDIKPANILLDRGVERVTITDFGLARAADDGSLTRTGVIAGTPQYMSPEQARGEPIGGRSDLFSLGSVLYAMCTGHPPFRAETGYGILRRITDGQPRSLREVNPEIPDWFESIILRLHAKSPVERFQTAEEVAELLEQCLAHVQQPTVTPLPDSLPSLSKDDGTRGWRKERGVSSGKNSATGTYARRWSRSDRWWIGIGGGVLSLVLIMITYSVGSRPSEDAVEVTHKAAIVSPAPDVNESPTDSQNWESLSAVWNDGSDDLLQRLEHDATRVERRAQTPWDRDSSRLEPLDEKDLDSSTEKGTQP